MKIEFSKCITRLLFSWLFSYFASVYFINYCIFLFTLHCKSVEHHFKTRKRVEIENGKKWFLQKSKIWQKKSICSSKISWKRKKAKLAALALNRKKSIKNISVLNFHCLESFFFAFCMSFFSSYYFLLFSLFRFIFHF